MEFREAGIVEDLGLVEAVVRGNVGNLPASAKKTLKHKPISGHVIAEKIQGQQRMPEVVQNSHEEDDIKGSSQLRDVINGHALPGDVYFFDFRRKPGLRQITGILINPEHRCGAELAALYGVEAGIAADIEHRPAADIRKVGLQVAPLHPGIVAEKMVRGGADATELHVVKPGAEHLDAAANLLLRHAVRAKHVSGHTLRCLAPALQGYGAEAT